MASYDSILNGPVASFASLSANIGSDVKTQCDLLVDAFKAQRDLLTKTRTMSTPDDSQMATIFSPCSQAMSKVAEFKYANRKSPLFNHLAAVGESTSALGWVAAPMSPEKFVIEMVESGKFYSNRVLKDFKEKDAVHVEWVKALFAIWDSLRSFVASTYPNGLVWAASSGGSPPPPPPAPMPASDTAAPAPTAALFAELNRGEKVTSGLRKVTDDMKMHKNPELKAHGEVPASAGKPKGAPSIPLRPDQRQSVKPPVLELRGQKWCVEHQVGNKDVIVNTTEKKQTVYIFQCKDSIIQVKGKINSIVMDSCTKTSLLFESVISSVDVVNCKGAAVQVTGAMPTINIDKTDGCQVYMSKESKNADIITAKSSEMNILIPKADGDFTEYPLPEQFKTNFTGTGMETKVNDLS